MKQEFSKKWKASKQPRKQRKYIAKAPLHIKHKFMSAPLSKELRKKYKIKNIEVKKGDEVKIMRGKFRKKQGKISEVKLKKTRLSIEGIQRTKKDGTKIPVWFHPSKVKITNLNLDDKKRLKRIKLEKKEKSGEKETKVKGEKNASKKK
jgi:large subunit ribosomal protein L24